MAIGTAVLQKLLNYISNQNPGWHKVKANLGNIFHCGCDKADVLPDVLSRAGLSIPILILNMIEHGGHQLGQVCVHRLWAIYQGKLHCHH